MSLAGSIVDKMLKHYKPMLAVSFLLLAFALGVLLVSYIRTGEVLQRGIDFKGGTEIIVPVSGSFNLQEVQAAAAKSLPGEVFVKSTKGISSTIIFESDAALKKEEVIKVLDALGTTYDASAISTQTVGAALGTKFWSDAKYAIIAAFLAMSAVVFFTFRTPVPSVAVVLAGVSDMVFAAAMMNLLGMKMSLATLAALLIIIGYSVDTDILLTTRLIKRHDEQPVDEKIKSSMKTGITLTLCAIAAMLVLYFVSTSAVLSEIALVITFGLAADLPFTWIQNVGILKWYLLSKTE